MKTHNKITNKNGGMLAGLLGIGLLAALIPAAQAAVVFNYGPSDSYVSEDIPFQGAAASTGSGPYVSTNSYKQLSPASGYSGPAFFGGYTFSSATYNVGFTNTASGQGIANSNAILGGKNTLYFNVAGPTNSAFWESEMSFASVFVFQQDSFNEGFTSGGLTVDGFGITLFKHGGNNPTLRFTPTGRWLVQIGETFYLSQATFTQSVNNESATFSISGNDLSNTQWAAYDPVANLFFDNAPAFQPMSLTNVTAVGFYVEDTSFRPYSGTVGMRFGVSEFAVTGIPEPSATGLLMFLILGGGAALALRKTQARAASGPVNRGTKHPQ